MAYYIHCLGEVIAQLTSGGLQLEEGDAQDRQAGGQCGATDSGASLRLLREADYEVSHQQGEPQTVRWRVSHPFG